MINVNQIHGILHMNCKYDMDINHRIYAYNTYIYDISINMYIYISINIT